MHFVLIVLVLMMLFPALCRIIGSMVLWLVMTAAVLALIGMAVQ
jgi:hypothetical protein